jgi:hypothetical protein
MALTLCALASCSSAQRGPGGTVSKVKIYRLDPTQRLKGGDPAIRFEKQHYLYGAITHAEQMNRAGQYYNVFWKVDDRSQPVTVRFEYRQRETGLKVKTKEVEITDVRRSNVTDFQVTGEEFNTDGPVTAWRASIVRGKEQLVGYESFLWN